MNKTDELKSRLKAAKKKSPKPAGGLSTGSTLLNLACSGHPYYAFLPGHYYLLVGDSNSGKSWISRTCLAEACLNKQFDGYRLIYDDVEGGALMDTVKFFGQQLADRLEPPRWDKGGMALHSETIEDFYYHIDDAFAAGKPFIYILDSIDALSSEDEHKKFIEHKKAYVKKSGGGAVADVKGSYGDGKAKKNSSNIRRLLGPLQRSGSILTIVNQTRDNIGFGAMFNPKTRSGGHALEFYASVQLWTAIYKQIKREYRDKKRQLGLIARIHVKRSRFTGKDRIIDLPIYHSSGISDVESCVNFLIEENFWKVSKGILTDCPLAALKGLSEEKAIRWIEEHDQEGELRRLTLEAWEELEDACAAERKNKYTAKGKGDV